MHQRPDREKNCHSREGGNPQSIGGERKVQLIMFTYLIRQFTIFDRKPAIARYHIKAVWAD